MSQLHSIFAVAMLFRLIRSDEGKESVDGQADSLEGAVLLLKQSRMSWRGFLPGQRPVYWLEEHQSDGSYRKVDEDNVAFGELYAKGDDW